MSTAGILDRDFSDEGGAGLIRRVRAGRSFAAEAIFRDPGACAVCGAAVGYDVSRTAPADTVHLCRRHRDEARRAYYTPRTAIAPRR